MSLQPGQRLGAYEVIAGIGAGGMGEVYRTRDTKLHRDVALKILPGAFALDAERLARFEREARVLASLNHPNIAGIYGLEEAAGIKALALEMVEGPTLEYGEMADIHRRWHTTALGEERARAVLLHPARRRHGRGGC